MQPPPPVEPTVPEGDELVAMNELQYLGTHNSYIVGPSLGLLNLLTIGSNLFPDLAGSGLDPAQLNYGHRPLSQQLASGLRTFELDLFADPEARGKGVGAALIEAVRRAAAEKGVTNVYWMTHETNATARKLYDRVSRRTGFIEYDLL